MQLTLSILYLISSHNNIYTSPISLRSKKSSFHNNNPLTTFLSILIIFAPSKKKKKKRETPSKNKSTKVFLKQVQLITAYSRPANEIPLPVKKPQFAREHSISGHLSAKLRCRFYAVSNCEGGGVGV